MPNRARPEESSKELKRLTRDAVNEARSLSERNREVLKKLEALNERITAHEKELARQRKPK